MRVYFLEDAKNVFYSRKEVEKYIIEEYGSWLNDDDKFKVMSMEWNTHHINSYIVFTLKSSGHDSIFQWSGIK